ncbi:MAG TPA: acyltransferase [Pseudomonadales bacterium]
MNRLKSTYWLLKDELKNIALSLVIMVPGRSGQWLRRKAYGARLKRLGEQTVMQVGFRVVNPENVEVGSHCNFADGVFITGGGGVTIGNWVGFGPDTKIWSVNHRFDDPDRPWLLQGWERKPVVIEDDVWLGANVFVMPGVTIGRGAIVSAGAVVSKSIPPYALVAGNPGRVVGWRKQPGGSSTGAIEPVVPKLEAVAPEADGPSEHARSVRRAVVATEGTM